MEKKEIILKNTILEAVTISSLGLRIEPGDSSSFSYNDILSLENSTELENLITSDILVVNNGSIDLATAPALEYLMIGSDFTSNYYSKDEADEIVSNIVINNITNVENKLVEDYFTKDEINQKIAEVVTTGIKGAVDYADELPTEGNTDGDIYIVRSSVGEGAEALMFVPDGQTALYLPFDSNWEDTLGHTSTRYGTSSLVEGKIGNCATFDGNYGMILFNSDEDFGEGPYLTVGCWIYPERTGTYGVIGRWSDEEDGEGWKIDVQGNKLRISLDTHETSGVSFTSPNNLPTYEWTHVAMVYNGSEVIMYINAVAVNSVSKIGSVIDSEDMSLYIGKYMDEYTRYNSLYSYNTDKYFMGKLDEVFLENRAMSKAELETLVFTEISAFNDEGFYKWDGSSWNILARNTGESGGTVSHDSLLNLNSGDYQHLTAENKTELISGGDTLLHNHHTHYYTKEEMDVNFAGIDNNYDTLYYRKSETDSLLNTIDFNKVSSNDSTTNITGAELETLTNGSNADSLHTHENISGSGSGGLDEAYDNNSEWNQGQGRTITIDAGPIQLTASNGFAPIRLTEINDAPTQWLGGGEMCYSNGELYIYDSGRSKWLAPSSLTASFGRTGNNRIGYMRFCGEIQTGSGYGGFVAPWNGTIVGISCNAKNNPDGLFEVGIDGADWNDFYWGGQSEVSWDNINIDFDANKRVTVWQSNDNEDPDYPTYTLFIKRRL